MSARGNIFNKALNDFQQRAYEHGGPAALGLRERTAQALVLVVDTDMRGGNWPCWVELDLQRRGPPSRPLKGRHIASFRIGEARDLAERNYLCALAEAVACVLVRDLNVSLNHPALLSLEVHRGRSDYTPWPRMWPDKDTVLGLARTLLTLSRLDAPEPPLMQRITSIDVANKPFQGARASMIVIDDLLTDDDLLW